MKQLRSGFTLVALLEAISIILALAGSLVHKCHGADGNRLTYLDDFCNPYYVSLSFAKLATPQWIGEEGVEAVVTLGIDDMRSPERYEAYLRPILDRLKLIDGRAPVSIMTNSIDPYHPQLQSWLKEGLSLETHTIGHPCPCLQGGDFQQAMRTYERCVDLLALVPNSHPVAFRFPCMDIQNTPSPRAFAEIFNRTTDKGNFLQISTSICNVYTDDDPAFSQEILRDTQGESRTEKYLPSEMFANKVENYPYPFVIGRLCWEFPCVVPDDSQGQRLHSARNPQTVADMKAAIDAAVVKQGVADFVFHPYDWLLSSQFVNLVDYATKKYGQRVKFLNFRECLERLNEHLLAGQPLRSEKGQDNGVRLLDANNDGYMDVVIGNPQLRRTRIWLPERQTWQDGGFPVEIVSAGNEGSLRDGGVRFGVFRDDGMASCLVANEEQTGIWHFDGQKWVRDKAMEQGLTIDDEPVRTIREGIDQGVRLRDLDGDGDCEIVVSNPSQHTALAWDHGKRSWQPFSAGFPDKAPIVDRQGRDAGLRFVDLDEDGYDDLVFSNEQGYTVCRYEPESKVWIRMRSGTRGGANAVPMIVRNNMNNGAWFANGFMWVQNEHTDQLPGDIVRRSFNKLLSSESNAHDEPSSRSPQEAIHLPSSSG